LFCEGLYLSIFGNILKPFFVISNMTDGLSKHDDIDFKPYFLVRNPHVQSILASSQLRTPRKNSMLDNSQELVVTTSAGPKLLSFYSRQKTSKGLIILLHGWEGSSSSAYILDAGNFYYKLGFSVCRLNLRDHGESHHLNEGLFHGALLDETFDAVNKLAQLEKNLPVFWRE
jgi:uncharacterized protein